MIIKATRIKAGDHKQALDYIVKNSVNESIDIQFGDPKILAFYCAETKKDFPTRLYTLRHFIISPENSLSEEQKAEVRDDLLKEFKANDRPFVHATHRKTRKDGSVEEHEHIMVAEINPKGRVITTTANAQKLHGVARRWEAKLGETIQQSRFNRTIIEHEQNEEIKAVLQQSLDVDLNSKKNPWTDGQFRKAERLNVDMRILHENISYIDNTLNDVDYLNEIEKTLSTFDIKLKKGRYDDVIVLEKDDEVILSLNKLANIPKARIQNMIENMKNKNKGAPPPPTQAETPYDFAMEEFHDFLSQAEVPDYLTANEKLDWINGRWQMALDLGLVPVGYPQPEQLKNLLQEKLNDEFIKKQQDAEQRRAIKSEAKTEADPTREAKYGSVDKERHATDFRYATTGGQGRRATGDDRRVDELDITSNQKPGLTNEDYRKTEQRNSRDEDRPREAKKSSQHDKSAPGERAKLIIQTTHKRWWDRFFTDKNWSKKSLTDFEDGKRLMIDMMQNSPVIALHLKKFRDLFTSKEVDRGPVYEMDTQRLTASPGPLRAALEQARALRQSYGFSDPLEGTLRALQQERMNQPNLSRAPKMTR
jgi:hypothetical protein